MRLTFLDLETTGTVAASDRIIEVAMVQVRVAYAAEGAPHWVEEARWSSLVAPGVSVGASERVHGISDAMVAEAPSLASLALEIARCAHGRTLVAHRAAFDRAFLVAAHERGELPPLDVAWIDTAKITDRVLGESGLRAVAARIGGRAPTHRALPDALAAMDALAACVETMGPVQAHELARMSEPAPSMRASDEELLRAAQAAGEPLDVVYRPASGRLREDRLHVEHVETPYVTGTLEKKGVRRVLRGDRIVRAWRGPRPVLRFL